MLLPLVGDPIVICPRFELGTLEADLAVEADVRLWEEDESPSMLLAGALRERRVATLAVDPAMAFLFVDRLRKAAPSVELIDGSSVIACCRMLKSTADLPPMAPGKAMTPAGQRRAARI